MSDDDLFLTAILKISRSALYLHPPVLTADQHEAFERMRARRAEGEPVQYITGFTEFFGYRFDVGPEVLVPRPETEVLADHVIRSLKAQGTRGAFILDIGTGSGCLAVTLVKEIADCRAVALDISPVALGIARRNAVLNGVEDRIQFIEQDMAAFLGLTDQRFDVIVANPPYIPTSWMVRLPQDVQHEPELALVGGVDGMHFFRIMAARVQRVLKPGGILAIEFGDGQGPGLEHLLRAGGAWQKIDTFNDNAGRPRVIMAQNII